MYYFSHRVSHTLKSKAGSLCNLTVLAARVVACIPDGALSPNGTLFDLEKFNADKGFPSCATLLRSFTYVLPQKTNIYSRICMRPS